jgi:Ca2+-binding EF-hand superfamily protein
MKKALCSQYTEEEVERIFHGVDVDEDGTLHYTEFLAAALTEHGRIEEQRIALAFDVFDTEDRGYISAQDLREILGKRATSDYVDRLVRQADADGDGKISYAEFKLAFQTDLHETFRKSLKQLPSVDPEST